MLPPESPIIIHPTPVAQQYIYKYTNGRRLLVEIDAGSNAPRVIREL